MRKGLKWAAIVFVCLIVLGALLPDEKKDQGDKAAKAGGSAQTASEEPAATPEPTPESTPEPIQVGFDGPSSTTADQVKLKGTVNVPGAKIKVENKKAKVNGGNWTAVVNITRKGGNLYKVVGAKAGHESDAMVVKVTRKLSPAEKAAVEAAARARKAAAAAAARQAFIASTTGLPYNQLQKNANRYKGTKVQFRGQIFQIQEEFGSTWMLLSVTDEGYDIWDDNVWVDYDGTIRGAEGDIITVYGTITGSKSYETQIGGSTFVPKMRAKYVSE